MGTNNWIEIAYHTPRSKIGLLKVGKFISYTWELLSYTTTLKNLVWSNFIEKFTCSDKFNTTEFISIAGKKIMGLNHDSV